MSCVYERTSAVVSSVGTGLKTTEKLVLAILASFTNSEAEAFPSVGDLAERAEVSCRQVQRALRRLEKGGWIVRSARRHPKLLTQVYIVALHPLKGWEVASDD